MAATVEESTPPDMATAIVLLTADCICFFAKPARPGTPGGLGFLIISSIESSYGANSKLDSCKTRNLAVSSLF